MNSYVRSLDTSLIGLVHYKIVITGVVCCTIPRSHSEATAFQTVLLVVLPQLESIRTTITLLWSPLQVVQRLDGRLEAGP